jgi:hypothetical protein
MPQIAPRRFAVGANTVRSTKGAQRTHADRSIIQNGKLIGAVTHVLIGEPTTGVRDFHTPCKLRRFAAALRALLRFRSARGAICARSLTSKLVDSASLDY